MKILLTLVLLLSLSAWAQNEQFRKDPQTPYAHTMKEYESGTKSAKCEQEAKNYIAGANLARLGAPKIFISVTEEEALNMENSKETPEINGIYIKGLDGLEPALATLIMDEMLVGYHAYLDQIKTHPSMKDTPPAWGRIGKQKYDACMAGVDA